MKKKNAIMFIALVSMLVLSVGCIDAKPEEPDNTPETAANPPAVDTGTEDITLPVEDMIIEPAGPSKEIIRGGEEYDYGDWTVRGALPDCIVLADKNWDFKSVNAYGGIWSDNSDPEAQIIYQAYIDLSTPPREAIFEKYGEIIRADGNVEHGEFISKYLSEAYYCRFEADGYVNIDLFFFYYPRGGFPNNNDDLLTSLYYYNSIATENDGATLNEEAFWKVAQSMFVAKDYEQDGTPIPYIPPSENSE